MNTTIRTSLIGLLIISGLYSGQASAKATASIVASNFNVELTSIDEASGVGPNAIWTDPDPEYGATFYQIEYFTTTGRWGSSHAGWNFKKINEAASWTSSSGDGAGTISLTPQDDDDLSQLNISLNSWTVPGDFTYPVRTDTGASSVQTQMSYLPFITLSPNSRIAITFEVDVFLQLDLNDAALREILGDHAKAYYSFGTQYYSYELSEVSDNRSGLEPIVLSEKNQHTVIFENDTSEDKSFNLYMYLGANANSTVALVPEPSTYAMLGLGLGLLGIAARRRRTS